MPWLYSSLDVVPTGLTGGGCKSTHTTLTSDVNKTGYRAFIVDYEYTQVTHTLITNLVVVVSVHALSFLSVC